MPSANGKIVTWCYLFVHHTKVERVNEKLKERFNTFIHKSIVYKQVKNRVKKEERPTISGLLFVQGDNCDIQRMLHEIDPALYLMNDCSTHRTAVIPDRVMQAFIRVSQMDENRIRFMPHALSYYSTGHPLVRVTSGVLSGFEGYIVRISRDKCLVTSVGDITVAIGGIHKETFENIETYLRLRREEQKLGGFSADGEVLSWQKELESCFFHPENQLDVVAIAGRLHQWIAETHNWMQEKRYADIAEIACLLLEKTGACLLSIDAGLHVGGSKDLLSVCRDAEQMLSVLAADAGVSAELKQYIFSQKQSLAVRYPFLSLQV